MGALWTTRAQQCTGTAGVAGSNHDLQSTVGFFQKTLIIQKILFIQKGTGGGGRAPAAPGVPPTPTSAGCTPLRPSPALAARCGGAAAAEQRELCCAVVGQHAGSADTLHAVSMILAFRIHTIRHQPPLAQHARTHTRMHASRV